MVATERQALLALSVPARPNLDNLSASDKNLIQDWWVACWDGPPPPPEGGSRNDWWKSSKHMHEKRYKVAVKRYKLLPNPAIAESTLASASSIVGLTQAGAAAIAALQAAAPPLATGHELVAPMDAPVDAHSLEASSLPIVFNGVELQGRMHLGDDWVARQYPNVTNLSSGRPVVTASGGHAVRRLSATVQSPGGRQGAAVDYVVYTLPAVESGEAMPRMDAHARHRMQGRHHAREAAAVKRLGTSFQKLGFARDNDMARKADFEKTLRLAFAAQLELCMPSEESSTTTAGNGKARRLSEEHGTEDDDMEEDDDGDGHAGDDTYASFETAGGGALDDLDELGSGTVRQYVLPRECHTQPCRHVPPFHAGIGRGDSSCAADRRWMASCAKGHDKHIVTGKGAAERGCVVGGRRGCGKSTIRRFCHHACGIFSATYGGGGGDGRG